jgi:hypothetical protein
MGTCKMNNKMALKLKKKKSYILELVHVKLSLNFFPELFNGELITPAFRKKNTQQKAANLLIHLTLTAERE